MIPRQPRAPRRAAILLVSASVLAACGGPAEKQPELRQVPPPRDLEDLDRSVREQFAELWENVTIEEPSSGTAWGRLGMWFQVYDEPRSAEVCLENARRLDASNARWPYYLGLLAQQDGELARATSLFAEATALEPEVAAPRIAAGDAARLRGDLEAAERAYREVLRLRSDQPAALFGLAQIALSRDEPLEAIELLEPVLELQPEASPVWYSLASAYGLLGDEDGSASALERVPANDQQTPLDTEEAWDRDLVSMDVGSRTLTRRGIRAFKRGDRRAAAALLGRAVEADPDSPEGRLNYAVALRDLGRADRALEQLRLVTEHEDAGAPLVAKALLETARNLADVGRTDAAIDRLRLALETDETSVGSHLLLGRLLHRKGDLAAAEFHYATARVLDPADALVRFWHVAILLALDRRQEGEELLEADLRERPESRELRLLRARTLVTGGAPSPAALREARHLVESSLPRDVLWAETTAMVAAAAGDFEQAITWQERVVQVFGERRSGQVSHAARRRRALYLEGRACLAPWESGEALVQREVAADPFAAEDPAAEEVGP